MPRVDGEEMGNLSFAERLQMRKNGFGFTTHARGEAEAQETLVAVGSSDKAHTKEGHSMKRKNKNCPTEMTSKRAVKRFRQVVEVPKVEHLDPRFNSLCGKLNEDLFQKSYQFLEGYKESEIMEMKNQLKKMSKKPSLAASDEYAKVQSELTRRQQEKKQNEKQQHLAAIKLQKKREERQAVAKGKNPYYLKKREKKNMELQARFTQLQKDQQLSKFMEKKRRKNASKDHRWLPTQRKQ